MPEGVAMVFVRTRYAIAFYLVIFGSMVVAAFKMGMVHERPHVGPAQGLDAPGTATSTATIQRDTVFEIQEAREVASEPPLGGGRDHGAVHRGVHGGRRAGRAHFG